MMKEINNSMPKTACDAFEAFLKNFVSGKSYVLNEESDLFKINNKQVLESTYEGYCSNSQEKEKGKDKKFEDVIKALKKNYSDRDKMIDVINHAVWLWALPNNRKSSWITYSVEEKPSQKKEISRVKEVMMKIPGVGGGGSGYVQTKTNGVRYLLYLFTKLCDVSVKDVNDAKETIKKECTNKNKEYSSQSNKYTIPDGVKNLLLHLCFPKEFEPIAFTVDKQRIVKAFGPTLLKDNDLDKEADPFALDKSIISIKKTILEKYSNQSGKSDFSFYNNSLPLFWKGEGVSDLSLAQKLEFKKAMILYGPPGTGKTHTAMELADEIILRYYIRKKKEDKDGLLDVLDDTSTRKQRISYLQFHINYNYEDFIAGHVIENGTVKPKEGFIFEVIKKAMTNPDIPYVVILDEINRTDISRVFGELFSGIEKRGKDISLPIENNLFLNVPDNLYFIGTMNEIDLSLERVDFALRRRFIWELVDYSEDALEIIINDRISKSITEGKLSAEVTNEIDLDSFISSCTALNSVVEELMGDTYHIGHSFFGEIVGLFVLLVKNKAKDPWNKAKSVLWEISIRPTLEAYCGSMDKSLKDDYLKRDGAFKTAYFGRGNAIVEPSE